MKKTVRRTLLLTALAAALLPSLAQADTASKRELVIGATAGPYADQLKFGIRPILQRQGYKVKVVEFNDYIQPNYALAEGSLDANAFQHVVYLQKFAADKKLAIVDLIKVPTAPIGVYSRKHKHLDAVKEGATVAIPNDPTNAARALLVLQEIGWVKLRDGIDPLKASEKDVEQNLRKIRLIPLEAAQLPRSLGDTDYSFVNGNFAIASGLKLTEALALEKTPEVYQNLVAVRTADKDAKWVKDIADAYRSTEFLRVTNERFAGFTKPDYQQALERR